MEIILGYIIIGLFLFCFLLGMSGSSGGMPRTRTLDDIPPDWKDREGKDEMETSTSC